jgi:hypothetical protein
MGRHREPLVQGLGVDQCCRSSVGDCASRLAAQYRGRLPVRWFCGACSRGHCFWQAGNELLQVGLVNIFSFCDGVRVVLSTSDMLPTFSGNDRFHKIFSQKNPFDLVHHINSRINVIQFMLLIKKVIKRPLHLVLALF